MKRIKVGIFVDNFFPNVDGVVMVVDNYATRLSKMADVYVVAPFYNENNYLERPYHIIRVKGINIPGLGYNLAGSLSDLSIKKKLMNMKFDIIHAHSPFTLGSLGIKIAKELKIPVVATLHSQFQQDFKRYFHSDHIASFITKKLLNIYNECNETYTVNSKMCEVFKEYGYRKNPIIIPNATDFELIDDKKKNMVAINKRFNLTESDQVLLFVGRITALKNIYFIIDTMKVLNKKEVSFKMLFVGDGTDLNNLKKYTHEQGLDDKVIFAGNVSERNLLKSIYARSKLFVFPSLYDTNSLVQIEAASQKVPAIFLKKAVTACNVKDNVNGFLGENDPEKFAKRIIDILNSDKLYEKVANGAYNEIYCTYDAVVNELYRRYVDLIENKEVIYEKNKN